MVSDPQISPDVEKICFMVTKPQLEKNAYETNLWLVERRGGPAVQFTSGGQDTFPVWSPDGSQIAFTSKRVIPEDEPGRELWVINLDGGEAKRVLTRPGGVSNIRWSPDGQKLLFLSAFSLPEEEEGVRVIRSLPINFDGLGIVYNSRPHLFICDLATKRVKQLTDGSVAVYFAEFSNTGTHIAYVAEAGEHRTFGMSITDLLVIPPRGGTATKLTASNMNVGPLAWSPDDHHIAFMGSDLTRGFTTHQKVFVTSVDGQTLKCLTADLDRTVDPPLYSDAAGPYRPIQGPVWFGVYIYFLISDHGKVNIYRVSFPEAVIEPVVQREFRVITFSLAPEVLIFSRTSPTAPVAIWRKEGDTVQPQTQFNPWLHQRQLVTPERFTFTPRDGVPIEGWIMPPTQITPGQKYPLILQIHGGPKYSYGYEYLHEFQFLTANGYVVAYMNPRGSDSGSEAFAAIRGHYGDYDYNDLMAGVDYLLQTYAFIDPHRLGVTGLSYGGYMTNWIIGHTDRFRAAVTQASISNLYSMFGTSDVGFHFVEDLLMGDPWTEEAKYLQHSPLRYVKHIKTPTLAMNMTEDHRCPFEQGLQFYTALQYFGVESELVLLSGSSHLIFAVGSPKANMAHFRHLKRWFDKYLQE